jgi:hypothetical protein
VRNLGEGFNCQLHACMLIYRVPCGLHLPPSLVLQKGTCLATPSTPASF